MKKFSSKKSGFLVVELFLTVTAGLVGFIGLYASQNSAATQDLARLRNLESLRNAMADHYVRFVEEPVLSSATGSQNIEKVSSINIGTGNKITNVTATSGFTFTKLNGNTCTKNSKDMEIIFYQIQSALVYCESDGGMETLTYK